MNPSFFPEFETDFKKLRYIHFGLVMGLAIFITAMLNFGVDDADTTFRWFAIESLAGLGLGVTATAISRLIFRKKTASIAKVNKQLARFEQLQQTYIISWALLEGAALFNVVMYFLAANGANIILATILTGTLLYSRPKKEWVQEQLINEG